MIDKKKAQRALDILLKRKMITNRQYQNYQEMNDEGVSYKDLMLEELGKATGSLYLREEYQQHKILEGEDLDFDQLSVPEVLLLEENEEWHLKSYSRSTEKFQAEAAEPWHFSLREAGYKPLPVVLEWFRKHPEFEEVADMIGQMVYL